MLRNNSPTLQVSKDGENNKNVKVTEAISKKIRVRTHQALQSLLQLAAVSSFKINGIPAGWNSASQALYLL